MRTQVVKISENTKTGRVAATYRPETSCPSACPLFGQGCYAENRIGGGPSLKMRAERYGTENADNVRAMAQFVPANGTIRLNVSGDFMADNDGTPDAEYIAACNDVAAARPDVTIIAYTHAWRTLTPATFAFTVNASCDNETDIADAIAAGWPTVVVEPGDRFTGRMFAGRRTVTCPNATTGVQCVDCKLCARPSRATVAFPVHGARKGAAGRAITAR